MDKETKAKRLFSEIKELVGGYKTKKVEIIEGLEFNQYETIKKIEFYSNSMFMSGQKDQLGRDKPFNNINTFRVNVAYRATDLDLKDISIVADDIIDKASQMKALILSKEAYKWGKNAGISECLNDFGYVRPKYGTAVVKKCFDDEGEMELEVCAWKNLVTDLVDIENGIIIERHYMQPHELAEKSDVWENTEELLNHASKSKKDIEVLEVHGYFPEALDPEADEDSKVVFNYKMFMIGQCGEKMYLLHSETEDECPYKVLNWRTQDGRALGVGIVEDGFQAQQWTNDALISEKNAMDLAGKVILQTNSKKVGNNVLTDLDNGSIVSLEDGKTITPINLMPNALPKYSELIARWDTQYERVSSTFNAITGEQMPSGTPYRQTAILNQEAGSLFDQRREEAGIFWSEIYMEWVLPYLIKKLNKEHVLTSEWSMEELNMIDEAFATYNTNRKLIEMVIDGKEVSPEIQDELMRLEKETLNETKNVRSIPVPKDYFKDFKYTVSVMVTNEMRNKSVILESLSNIMGLVGANPAVLQDPVLSKVFGAIVDVAGLPISVSQLLQSQLIQQQIAPQQPQGQQPQVNNAQAAKAEAELAGGINPLA